MNVVRRIIDILTERAAAIMGALFVSRLETLAALQQADHENELEDRAQQLEQEGKPHLAATLRSRAAGINPEDPGAQGQCIIRRLQRETSNRSLLSSEPQVSTPAGTSEGASGSDEPLPHATFDKTTNDAPPQRRKTVARPRRRSAPRE
jgi:hypothetical protein